MVLKKLFIYYLMNKIAVFLSENYVENNKYRYNYSEDFLTWYLDEDSLIDNIYNQDELIGFICGKKVNMILNGEKQIMAEIDFLCIKKDNRNKKLCPTLINNIKQKFNNIGIYNAIFTSEHNYPNKITHCDYYIRFINIKKLYDIGYININDEKNFELPKIKGNKKLIKIDNEKELLECFDLYNKYYKRFDCYEDFNNVSFIKRFNNKHINIFGLVENNKIIDFISYYTIDINVINTNKISTDGYLYIYTNNSNNLHRMISLLLHKLKENNIDSFIALNIMENTEDIMNDLKFINKKSNYNYYFFQNNNNINNNISNNKMAKILF
jgi:glycylpeptide N-tetradecanoyltransferase